MQFQQPIAPIYGMFVDAWVLFDPINISYHVLHVVTRKVAEKNAKKIVEEIMKAVGKKEVYFALIKVPVILAGNYAVTSFQIPYIYAVISGLTRDLVWADQPVEIKTDQVPLGLRLDQFLKKVMPPPSEFYEKYHESGLLKKIFLKEVK